MAGAIPPTMKLNAYPVFRHDKREEGWTLLDNTPLVGEPELELVEFLKPEEGSISGACLLERAAAFGNLAGQHHAERMLLQQDKIPQTWQKFSLIFLRTKWQRPDGGVLIPQSNYGYKGQGKRSWTLYIFHLESPWDRHSRLVRFK